jgi:hypothetical protein
MGCTVSNDDQQLAAYKNHQSQIHHVLRYPSDRAIGNEKLRHNLISYIRRALHAAMGVIPGRPETNAPVINGED